MTTFTHSLSGRSFVATDAGRFGAASVDGSWDTGEAGTIWPAETPARRLARVGRGVTAPVACPVCGEQPGTQWWSEKCAKAAAAEVD